MSNDLMMEIEEEMQKEKLQNFWKEYGNFILGGAIAAILLTGGISAFRAYENRSNTEQTQKLITAFDDENKAADTLAEIAPELPASKAALARISAAGRLVETGGSDKAVSLFRETAKDKSTPAIYRDLALISAIRIESDLPGGTAEKAKSWISELAPLVLDNKNPWQIMARFQTAMIQASFQREIPGALELAIANFDLIKNSETAPVSLRDRAEAFAQLYRAQMSPTSAPHTAENSKTNPPAGGNDHAKPE